MAEEHLEAAASGQAKGWFEQRKDPEFRKRQDASLFQAITLVMLPFIWAGFVYSLATGNELSLIHISSSPPGVNVEAIWSFSRSRTA